MSSSILQAISAFHNYLQLPLSAKAEHRKDRSRRLGQDPGVDRAIKEGVAWLCHAQDNSASADGGVARHYSLINGWSSSYPETTGFIIPTILAYARLYRDETVFARAKRMLDWLVSIQLPEGGFQGGMVDSVPVASVAFNTGQILLGLASGAREFGQYREALRRAADWLVLIQDSDGCWRRFFTPFAIFGEKTYDTHIAWGLLEADCIEPDKSYAKAALANVRWALSLQRENGWFEKCCLSNPLQPLTHTIGYALRGVIEAYRFTKDTCFLQAAQKTATGLLTALREDGFLPGQLDSSWNGTVNWSCLTGTAQIAICWLMLFQDTGAVQYRDAAYAANRYLRCRMDINGRPETRGAIKGSFPVYGGYNAYQYLSWACKFFVDSNILEKEIRGL